MECRTLILRGCQVADLAPLIETGSREQDHRYSRQLLDFRDTPAARANVRLSALAGLADTDCAQCFDETKSYLRARLTPGASLTNRDHLKARGRNRG